MKIKNLLGKKVTILGKAIPATILALVLLGGLGSAALVGYLSNMVKATVSVESPIEQLISEDGETWDVDDTISFNTHGGGLVTFFVRDTNVANVPITGIVENIVTNEDGLTCNDFESVILTTTTKIDGVVQSVSGPHDLIEYYNSISYDFCQEIGTDGKTIIFSYGPNAPSSNEMTFAVGQEDTSEITVTFKTDATGTYTFISQILPVV